MGGAGAFRRVMKKTSTQMPTLFPFILRLLYGIKLNLILWIKFSPKGLLKFTSVLRILPKYGISVVCFNKKCFDNLEPSNFSKIPSLNVRYIIVWLDYQNISTTGVWEQCWHCIFCFLPIKAAILSHMTSKLFTQTKDNEMYKCIKFHLLIP